MLAAIEWASVQRPQWLPGWLQQNRLQGWEISREVADGAKRVLAAAGKALGVPTRPRVNTVDALMSDEREVADAILLFPPWIDYRPGSGNALPPDRRSWFARKFGSFASYPTSHGAFTELAARLVKRGAGRVGVLLPYEVADKPEFGGFRRSLAQHLSPEQILPQSDELPNLEGQPTLFVFTAGKGDVSGEPWESRSDENEQVFQTSLMRHPPLPPNTFRDIGVNFGNSAALLIAEQNEPGAYPMRDASDIIAFGTRNPQLFIRAKVRKVTGFYARIAPPSAFKQIHILIRREGGRPVAALHRPAAFFRDDLIGCHVPETFDDEYLLGIINSEHYARMYRDSFKEGRLRAEGRITVDQLHALPVPTRRAAGRAYDEVVGLTRELLQVAGRNARLVAALDEAVKRAYRGKS